MLHCRHKGVLYCLKQRASSDSGPTVTAHKGNLHAKVCLIRKDSSVSSDQQNVTVITSDNSFSSRTVPSASGELGVAISSDEFATHAGSVIGTAVRLTITKQLSLDQLDTSQLDTSAVLSEAHTEGAVDPTQLLQQSVQFDREDDSEHAVDSSEHVAVTSSRHVLTCVPPQHAAAAAAFSDAVCPAEDKLPTLSFTAAAAAAEGMLLNMFCCVWNSEYVLHGIIQAQRNAFSG
jgi:hypothetical protein